MRVTFSQPVAGVKAYVPIEVNDENLPILRQAARMGLRPSAWREGRQRWVHAHSKNKRGYAPLIDAWKDGDIW